MKTNFLKTAALILVSVFLTAPAFAESCRENMGCAAISSGPTVLTFSPLITTSEISGVHYGIRKLVMAAREDAAYFVTSEGQVRTAKMEEVLQVIRDANPGVEVSDFEIAQAILAL